MEEGDRAVSEQLLDRSGIAEVSRLSFCHVNLFAHFIRKIMKATKKRLRRRL